MHARHDDYVFTHELIEDGVGEPSNERSPSVSVYDRMACWVRPDRAQWQFAPPRGTRRRAQLVGVRTTDTPPRHPRRRPAEGSGSLGSTDPADDLVPRNPRRPFVVQVLEPTVELGSLGFRQRHSLGRLAE